MSLLSANPLYVLAAVFAAVYLLRSTAAGKRVLAAVRGDAPPATPPAAGTSAEPEYLIPLIREAPQGLHRATTEDLQESMVRVHDVLAQKAADAKRKADLLARFLPAEPPAK